MIIYRTAAEAVNNENLLNLQDLMEEMQELEISVLEENKDLQKALAQAFKDRKADSIKAYLYATTEESSLWPDVNYKYAYTIAKKDLDPELDKFIEECKKDPIFNFTNQLLARPKEPVSQTSSGDGIDWGKAAKLTTFVTAQFRNAKTEGPTKDAFDLSKSLTEGEAVGPIVQPKQKGKLTTGFSPKEVVPFPDESSAADVKDGAKQHTYEDQTKIKVGKTSGLTKEILDVLAQRSLDEEAAPSRSIEPKKDERAKSVLYKSDNVR